MSQSKHFEHYEAYYIKLGIALYKDGKFIQVFDNEDEVLSYARATLEKIGYFIRRFKPIYQDTPIKFLREETHPTLPSICESKWLIYGTWESVSYNGKKQEVSLTSDVPIQSSWYSTISTRGLMESDPYIDKEDIIANMSDEEYERYLKIKRIKV